jgi:hypothetical protein
MGGCVADPIFKPEAGVGIECLESERMPRFQAGGLAHSVDLALGGVNARPDFKPEAWRTALILRSVGRMHAQFSSRRLERN